MADATLQAKLQAAESPRLESTARLRESRLSIWRNCLLSLPFVIGNQRFLAATSAVSTPFSGDSVLVGLKLSNGHQAFNLVVPEAFLEDVISANSAGISMHVTEDDDLILVIEQVISEPLEQIANLLGAYCEITGIERDLAPKAANDGFQFDVTDPSGVLHRCAVLFDDRLEARIIERIEPVSSPHEKTVADHLDVRIGPIILSRQDIARLSTGQILDCGVQPTDQIRGLLLRSDDQFWPGFIDDSGIQISGNRQPMDHAKARRSEERL